MRKSAYGTDLAKIGGAESIRGEKDISPSEAGFGRRVGYQAIDYKIPYTRDLHRSHPAS
jgi:hypothetical protein